MGAADDEAKSVDLVYAKTHLDLAHLAGLDVVRMTSIWAPGRTAPGQRELWALRNASIAAGLNGMRIVLSVYQYGSRTTPLTATRQRQFARYAAAIVRSVPGVRLPDRRQRAQPEPVLDAAVHACRQAGLAAGLRLAARAHLRRGQEGLAARDRDRRRAGAARLRQREAAAPHALADPLPPGDGPRVPREQAQAQDHGRARDPSVPAPLEPAARGAAPEEPLGGHERLRQARRAR